PKRIAFRVPSRALRSRHGTAGRRASTTPTCCRSRRRIGSPAADMKISGGRFFEDFSIGQHLVHAVPRTLHGGDISTYIALTGDRHPLASSTELARSLGFVREVLPDLLV